MKHYLLECSLCKRQYIGKSEIALNIRLNNHCNDIYKTNTPEADKHFRLPSYCFNRHAKFTLIPQLDNTELDKELLTLRLKNREDFWMHKLKTLKLHGLNAELNLPNR